MHSFLIETVMLFSVSFPHSVPSLSNCFFRSFSISVSIQQMTSQLKFHKSNLDPCILIFFALILSLLASNNFFLSIRFQLKIVYEFEKLVETFLFSQSLQFELKYRFQAIPKTEQKQHTWWLHTNFKHLHIYTHYCNTAINNENYVRYLMNRKKCIANHIEQK